MFQISKLFKLSLNFTTKQGIEITKKCGSQKTLGICNFSKRNFTQCVCEVMSISNLLDLPRDHILSIVSWLNVEDILNLMTTNRSLLPILNDQSLWGLKMTQRYPTIYNNFKKYRPDWKLLYKKTYLLRLSVVDKCYVCHLGDRYWLRKKTEQSEYGVIAYLQTVCWLEILCKFDEVPSGSYNVHFRMSLTKTNSAQFKAKWTVRINGDDVFAYSHPMNDRIFRDHNKKGWFVFNLGTIDLTEPSAVEIHILGGNPHWFEGLAMDWVRLYPNIENEKTEPCILPDSDFDN